MFPLVNFGPITRRRGLNLIGYCRYRAEINQPFIGSVGPVTVERKWQKKQFLWCWVCRFSIEMSQPELGGPVLLKQGYMRVCILAHYSFTFFLGLNLDRRSRQLLAGQGIITACYKIRSLPLDPTSLSLQRMRLSSTVQKRKIVLGRYSPCFTHNGLITYFCVMQLKKANCIEIVTEKGKACVFECENCDEHRQWFDALYYATNVGRIAEYCSPLSGGWLHFCDKGEWRRLWFVIKNSFLMCCKCLDLS